MDSYQLRLNHLYFVILLTTALMLTACASPTPKENLSTILISSIKCSHPRPQICTKEYNPVCATLQDGQLKTYATGCMACSDTQVKAYKNGECSY